MENTTLYAYAGLDLEATGRRISRYIDESGLRDKELGARMRLSVQSINKWRHGHCLPDIENLYILSRILGVRVDDFLVASGPQETHVHHPTAGEAGLDPASCLFDGSCLTAHRCERQSAFPSPTYKTPAVLLQRSCNSGRP